MTKDLSGSFNYSTETLIDEQEDLKKQFKEIISKNNSAQVVDENFLIKFKLALEKKIIVFTFADLENAMLNGHIEMLEAMFNSMTDYEKNITLNCSERAGQNLLHILAQKTKEDSMDEDSFKKIVDLLLKNGVQINVADKIGMYPISYVISRKNYRLFKVLMDKNLNRSDPSNQGCACYINYFCSVVNTSSRGNPDHSKPITYRIQQKGIINELKSVITDQDQERIYQEFLIPLFKSGVIVSSPLQYDTANNLERAKFVIDFLNSDFIARKLEGGPESQSYQEVVDMIHGLLRNHSNSPFLSVLIGKESEELKSPFTGRIPSFVKYAQKNQLFSAVQSPVLRSIISEKLDEQELSYKRFVESIESRAQVSLEEKDFFPENQYIVYDSQSGGLVLRSASIEYLKKSDFVNLLRISQYGYDFNFTQNYSPHGFAFALGKVFNEKASNCDFMDLYALKFLSQKLIDNGFNFYWHNPIEFPEEFQKLNSSLGLGLSSSILQQIHLHSFDNFFVEKSSSDLFTVDVKNIAVDCLNSDFFNFLLENKNFFLLQVDQEKKVCFEFAIDNSTPADPDLSLRSAQRLFKELEEERARIELNKKTSKGFVISFKDRNKKVIKMIPNYGIANYQGDMVLYQPQGFGKLTFEDGSSYIGEFKDGLFHGKGKILFKDKDDNLVKREAYFCNGKIVAMDGELEDIICPELIDGFDGENIYKFKIDAQKALELPEDIFKHTKEHFEISELQIYMSKGFSQSQEVSANQTSLRMRDQVEVLRYFLTLEIIDSFNIKIKKIINQSDEFLLVYNNFLQQLVKSIEKNQKKLNDLESIENAHKISSQYSQRERQELEEKIAELKMQTVQQFTLIQNLKSFTGVANIVKVLGDKIIARVLNSSQTSDQDYFVAKKNGFELFVKELLKAVVFNEEFLEKNNKKFLTFDKNLLDKKIDLLQKVDSEKDSAQLSDGVGIDSEGNFIREKIPKMQSCQPSISQTNLKAFVEAICDEGSHLVNKKLIIADLTPRDRELIEKAISILISDIFIEDSFLTKELIDNLKITIGNLSSDYGVSLVRLRNQASEGSIKKDKVRDSAVNLEKKPKFDLKVKSTKKVSSEEELPGSSITGHFIDQDPSENYFLGLKKIRVESKKTQEISFNDYSDFAFGCGYFLSFDQSSKLSSRLLDYFKKQEFKDSYAKYCDDNGFKKVITTNNNLKHYFHNQFDALVDKISENNPRLRTRKIKDGIYFVLAFCLAKSQRQLAPFIDDLSRGFGLGHASQSSSEELLKLIFIIENLAEVYDKNPKFDIVGWSDNLQRFLVNQQKPIEAQDPTKKYETKVVEVDDREYLSNLIEGLASCDAPRFKTLKTRNFCLLYCRFFSEIFKADQELEGQSLISDQYLRVFESLNKFLNSKEVLSDKELFNYLNDNQEVLNIISDFSSSQFFSYSQLGFDNSDCFITSLKNLEVFSSRYNQDEQSLKSQRLEELLEAFLDNDLIKVKDLREENSLISNTKSSLLR